MRKKFFSALLLMTLAVPLTGALVSCSDYDDDISSLRDDVTSLKSQLETTKSDLEAQLTTIKGDFAAQIQAAVEGKADKSELDKLNEQLLAAESKLQAQIDAVNEAIEGLNEGVNANAEKIKEALETLAAVTGDVDALGGRVTDLEGSVGNLQGDVDGLGTRIGAVEKNLEIQQTTLDNFLAALKAGGFDNIDALVAAVNKAKDDISDIQEKVSGLEEQVGDNTTAINELKESMGKAESALSSLNGVVAGLQGQIDALTVYIEKMLSGLVFAPDFYYGGIEAMEATTIQYTPIVLSNNSTLEKPEVETWRNLKMDAYLTPDIVANYHMNPSYFDVTKIKSMKVVSDDKEYVQVGNTRAAASAPSVVEGSWLNSKDGMLSATINLDANAVKDDPSHVTVLAVQACFNGKDGKDSVVTSDYAAVAKSTIRNVVIADPEVKGTSCTMEKFHVYTFAKDAIANDPTQDLVYNDPEGVDLTKLVQAHFNRNGSSTEQAMDDVSKYGMKWKFAVSHYTAGGNKTSESAHIYLKDNHAIACTVDASGKPQPGSQDRSSIGREPMVRVTLVDTTKTENNIVAVGFIKFKIAAKAADAKDAINIDFNGEGYDLSCKDYNYTLTWSQIEEQVLGKLNLSKEEFEKLYNVKMKSLDVCQIYEKTEDGTPVVATQYGTVKVIRDADEAHLTNVLSWTIPANAIYNAVWDKETGTYKTGVNLETGVKFTPKNDTTRPDVYVWFHTGTITTPTATLENNANVKNSHRWAATNSTIGSGFDEVHNYVGTPNQDVLTFTKDLLSVFVGNKINLTTTGSDAFKSDVLTYDYRFMVTDAHKEQTGQSGTKYTMTVSTDGHELYANASGMSQMIAELDGSTIEYKNDKGSYARDLLNAAAHTDLAHSVTATVAIYAQNACGMELPIKNNTFDVKFLRPIDATGVADVAFTDAIDGGNQIDKYLLLSFTDWRGEWSSDFVQAPNAGYGIDYIIADINGITTDMSGKDITKDLLSSVTKDIVFTQDYTSGKSYGGAKFGQLTYKNVGHVTSTFKVRVPVTVQYYWGEVKTYVDITVNATQGNKVARR